MESFFASNDFDPLPTVTFLGEVDARRLREAADTDESAVMRDYVFKIAGMDADAFARAQQLLDRGFAVCPSFLNPALIAQLREEVL